MPTSERCAECDGVRIQGEHCLAHLTLSEWQRELERLRLGERLEAGCVAISRELLMALLADLVHDEEDRPRIPPANFRRAQFSVDGSFDPLTERVFRAAGLEAGMRVLDIGSGAGDVAMLAARLVGPDGAVVGVERDPDAVTAARERVERAGVSNVRLVEGDVQTLAGVEGTFDAAVGRLVLMYLPDPAVALSRVSELVAAGGLVCVQEGDMAYDWAQPMTPLWSQVRAWFLETLERARVAPRMGLSLCSTFLAAGLPTPQLCLECAVGGGADAPTWGWANVARGVLPLMERLGVATAADLQPDTLAERLLEDIRSAQGVVIGPRSSALGRARLPRFGRPGPAEPGTARRGVRDLQRRATVPCLRKPFAAGGRVR